MAKPLQGTISFFSRFPPRCRPTAIAIECLKWWLGQSLSDAPAVRLPGHRVGSVPATEPYAFLLNPLRDNTFG
jgi:hypothetical protein